MNLVKALEQQKKFKDFYLDCNKVKRKIIYMFDKCCMLSLEAVNLEQVCLQLHFAKSDCQFSKYGLLSSGAVARLRFGNERNAK